MSLKAVFREDGFPIASDFGLRGVIALANHCLVLSRERVPMTWDHASWICIVLKRSHETKYRRTKVVTLLSTSLQSRSSVHISIQNSIHIKTSPSPRGGKTHHEFFISQLIFNAAAVEIPAILDILNDITGAHSPTAIVTLGFESHVARE